MALADVIKTALDQLQYIAKTETIIGEPIVAGNVTLIPVSRVSIGFAAGGAGRDDTMGAGAGTGGGVTITPIAFVSVVGDKVQIHSVEQGELNLGKVLSMAPDLFGKISKYMKKKDEINSPEKEC